MSKQLEKLESQIESGIQDVGLALLQIHEKELYLEVAESFEDYCKKRWNFSRQRGYQLVNAAKVQKRLSTMVDTPPTSERQLRAISNIPEKKQAAVVAEVMEACEKEGREPTAKDYQQAAKALNGKASSQVEKKKPLSDYDRFRKFKSTASQHNGAMMRDIDEMQELKANNAAHKKLLVCFRQIDAILNGWR